MLRVQDMCFSFGGAPVLEDVSFTVEPGCLCGLFGPNGCGKTTLFRCCLGFLKNGLGSVFLDGRNTKKMKIKEMARAAAYVPQEHKPPFPYPVREVVLMGRTPHMGGIFGAGRQDKIKAMEALELLEIQKLADHPYNQLSGGQRQMVLIARAIAQQTKIMFLDEPTSALDFSNQIRIWRIMRRVADAGTTILACSHDPNHVSWFCDQVVVMNGRGLMAQGPPSEVITQETLSLMYQDLCSVKKVDGLNMVMPSGLAARAERRDDGS